MTLEEYFSTEPPGSIQEMAQFLGITTTWMSLLVNKHRQPSPELSVKIEKATQGLVTRGELRPDIFLV